MGALPPPRVLIVSRRTVRKNKFVDFVGEYHLDLIVKYGAVPIIVPRINGLDNLLDGFEPIHGVLLCEGEDVDPSLYNDDGSPTLTKDDVDEINKLHSSDVCIDKDRDSIEMQLTKRCLDRGIPFLGICRGCQVLNVACGGTLYKDVEHEIKHKGGLVVKHIDYDDYDGYRHPITIIKDTPLHMWFKESLSINNMRLNVNSYHHQGIKYLPPRFRPMAFSPCGLVEGFYDPFSFHPNDGKYIVGLQFHPERMRKDCKNGDGSQHMDFESLFDYPGCPLVYEDFITSVIAYQQKTLSFTTQMENTSLDSLANLMDDCIRFPQFGINSKPFYTSPFNVKLNGFNQIKIDCMVKHKNSSQSTISRHTNSSLLRVLPWKQVDKKIKGCIPYIDTYKLNHYPQLIV